MKRNKGNTGKKKGWQKADARVLGQILAAQNIDFVLPDISHVAGFFAETLNAIPGIASSRVCLEGVTVQRGEMDIGICEECLASRKRAAGQEEISQFLPGFDFKCRLGEQPGMHVNVVASLHHPFGFFVFQVSDPDVFNTYKPFISNLANYVALSLENRLQRDLLQEAYDEMEHKVEERTRDLLAINKHLQDEIETRRQAENALKESEKQIRQLVDASPVAMVIYSGSDERVEMVNDKFIELFGYTIEDAPDVAHWWPLAYPDEKYREEIRTQWQAKVEQAISGKGPVEPLEATVTCKDGSRRYIEFRLSSIGQKHLTTFTDLTGRQRADETLRASEERFRDLYENAPNAYFSIGADGFIHRCNKRAGELLGYTVKELVGRPAMELYANTPYGKEKAAHILQRFKAGETVRDEELEMQRVDGSPVWISLTVDAIRDAEGRIVESRSMVLNITERKQAEDALRASEERLQLALDAAKMGQWEWNIATGEVVWSQQCLALYGLPPGTPMSYEKFLQTLHPEDRERVDAALCRAVEERTGYDVMKRTIWPDGTIHWTASRGQVYCDAAGEPIRMVGVTLDISKWKEAEAQLLASEQLFRALVENSPDYIARYDREFRRIYVNPAIQKLFAGPPEDVLGTRPSDQTPLYAPQIYIEHLRQAIETAAESTLETPFRTTQGEMHWGQIRFVPEFDSDGKVASVLTIGRDIHEIKENERRFRMLAENFPDFVMRFDHNGRYTYVNPAIEKAFGLPAEAIVGKTLHELPRHSDPRQNDALFALIQRAFDEAIPNESEAHWDTETGERIFEVRHAPEKDATGNVASVLSVARDITERKRAEESLRKTSVLLERIFSTTEFLLVYLDADFNFIRVNRAYAEATEGKSPEFFEGKNHFELYPDPENEAIFRRVVGTGEPYVAYARPFEYAGHPERGATYWNWNLQPVKEENGRVNGLVLSLINVTERERAYITLRQHEEQLRLQGAALEAAANGFIITGRDGKIIWVNPAFTRLTGYPIEEVVGQKPNLLKSGKQGQDFYKNLWDTILSGQIWHGELVNRHKDGHEYTEEMTIAPLQAEGGEISHFIAVKQDITGRKQHEREREAIITVSNALRQARTRIEILNVILDQLVDLFDADGAVLALPDPKTDGCIYEMGRGAVGEKMIGLSVPPEKGIGNWAIKNKKTYLNNHADRDPLFYRPDLLGDSHCVVAAPLATQELVIGALWVARQADFLEQDLRLLIAINNIAANAVHRVTLHEQTEQQLRRLIALHQIDLAISTSFDLYVTLNVILGSVKVELGVDAASILLLNPVTHTLDYAAGIGFRTHNIEQSHVRVGNGCAGRAALEQRTVFSLNLREAHETFSRFSFLSGEDFTAHYATPLVIKGQVKGVLEIFHRTAIEPEPTWLGYFETLATQSAIAIDNASLFENLQRSNMELILAYDATIEGWSRALDLRDRETEGHTQRVAEMALELAEKMGMNGAEQVDLRRGALLHDIGKMGIPDAILLKPAHLSDEERKIMQQHPLYAYQMLSPIKYLQHALEIPYCHHEKWDGSGYPRGLKGDEIPLSARVFAVVDVFDALTSDRPYSKAWPREKAYRYIEQQAGKHFDPQIVKLFLETI